MAAPVPLTPVVPVITAEQQKLINDMKEKVKSVYTPKRHSDEYLLRFLKARSMDLQKGSDMFIACMNWRKDNNVDTILQTFPTSPYFAPLLKYWPSAYIGELQTGYKVFYEKLGAVDVRNLLRAVPLDALVSYHIYILESQERDRRRQYKTRGYSLPFVNVQDCEGLGMNHAYTPGLDFLKALTKIDEANYPEMVQQIYFINTPSVFNVIYKMISPFVPQSTIDKLRLDKEELIRLFPADSVPVTLGGPKTLVIANGGFIEDKDLFEGKRITVNAGEQFETTIDVAIPGSSLHVHFSTESNDIGFSLLFKTSATEAQARPLIPSKRYDSHLTACHVEYPTQEPGIYIAQWDNSFSKWTSKNLYYHVIETTAVQQAQKLDEILRVDPVMQNSNGSLLPKARQN